MPNANGQTGRAQDTETFGSWMTSEGRALRRPAITSWNDRRSCARVARRCSCTCCTNWAKVSSGVKLAVAISELTNEPIDCANGLPRRSVGYSTATISCSV